MLGVGRRLASQHRCLASNPGHGSFLNGREIRATQEAQPSPAPNRGRPSAGILPSNVPVMGRKYTTSSLMKTEGCNPVPSQHTLGTLSGQTARFSTNSDSGDDNGNGLDLGTGIGLDFIDPGDTQALCQRVIAQVGEMKNKVLAFEPRYLKCMRPRFSSRCLIVPGKISDPSTVFLHRQTFEIASRNPSFVSCFDVMSYDSSLKDDVAELEWNRFLDHMVDRKIYIIEDWAASYSTIEALMYDHGLKQPDDGTGEPFYKGECDASFDPKTKTASFSYIIWKDNKIIYSEVFADLKCASATDAEIYAACALLYKAEELQISKLLVCSDSKTVANILNGEHPIHMNHPNRDFYMTLRSMRSRFKRLVVMWRPRELMLFADDLAKSVKLSGSDKPFGISKYATEKWAAHLSGLPVYRVERMKHTSTAVKKFKDVMLDASFGKDSPSVYFIEVEEDLKLDCLLGLRQALEPFDLNVVLSNFEDKPASFKQHFKKDYNHISKYESDSFYMFRNKFAPHSRHSKCLIVSLDYTVPRQTYYSHRAFHVVLITPSERESMTEDIPELTAMGYVYFHGVTLPLNKPKNGEKKPEPPA